MRDMHDERVPGERADDETMADELTDEERSALAALPRERDPGPLLEARTVAALRARGVLRPSRSRWRVAALPWIAAAAACAAAVFLGGIAVGQQMGSRAAVDAFAASGARNADEVAMLVQQTGSAYVAALARLAELSDGAAEAEGAAGREVAARLFHAAADELVRIAPDDPLASGILAGFDVEARRDTTASDTAGARHVIWF
jgi:hypothetical protein